MAKLLIFNNPYETYEALENVLHYVGDGTRSSLIGGQNILVSNPFGQAMGVEKAYFNQTKKKILHFSISFSDKEYISLWSLFEEGYKICSFFQEYQILFAVHQDTKNLHVHFALIPVNLRTGRKLNFCRTTIFAFLRFLREVFAEYEIGVDLEWS